METKLIIIVLVVIIILLISSLLFLKRKHKQSHSHSEDNSHHPIPEKSQDRILVSEAKEDKDTVFIDNVLEVDFDKKNNYFLINSLPKPDLFMKKGKIYQFNNLSDHPLYFSTSEEGHPEMEDAISLYKGNPKVLLQGSSIILNADENCPEKFYYNSTEIEGAGSTILIIPVNE